MKSTLSITVDKTRPFFVTPELARLWHSHREQLATDKKWYYSRVLTALERGLSEDNSYEGWSTAMQCMVEFSDWLYDEEEPVTEHKIRTKAFSLKGPTRL